MNKSKDLIIVIVVLGILIVASQAAAIYFITQDYNTKVKSLDSKINLIDTKVGIQTSKLTSLVESEMQQTELRKPLAALMF